MDLSGDYMPSKMDTPPVKKNTRVKKMADEPPTEKNVMVKEPKRILPMGVDKKEVKNVMMEVSKQSKAIHKHAKKTMKPEVFAELDKKREEMHERHKGVMKEAKAMDKMDSKHEIHKHLVEKELDPIRVRSAIANIRENHKKAAEHAIATYKADVKIAKAELRKEMKKKRLSPPSHSKVKASAVAEAVAEEIVLPKMSKAKKPKYVKWGGPTPYYKGDIVEHKGQLYKAFTDVSGTIEPPSPQWVKL